MYTDFIAFLGNLVAFLFAVGVFYVAFTTKNPTEISDTFELGFVEYEREEPVVVNVNNNITPPPPEKPKVDEKLKQDCVDVLIKLGFKKGQARKRVSEIFSTSPPKNIQDFLRKAL